MVSKQWSSDGKDNVVLSVTDSMLWEKDRPFLSDGSDYDVWRCLHLDLLEEARTYRNMTCSGKAGTDALCHYLVDL